MKFIYTIFVSLIFSLQAYNQTITIGPGGDYPTLSSANDFIHAGDRVMLFDGTFSNGSQFLEDLIGTSQLPIIIYSESHHGVTFNGGTEAIHLVNCSYVILDGFVIQNQSGNGINIDDGGDYSTPTHHIEVRNCLFRNIASRGNNDFLKLSGLKDFVIHNCEFIDGSDGGSGIDMVGCHIGQISDNLFDNSGSSGIQAKGGTDNILISRNILKNMSQRALNLGGSTGLQFFRPPLPNPIVNAYEAANLEVYSNIFIGSVAPIAYVGCINVKVNNNTIYYPGKWAIRILQETTVNGFLPCSNNEFRNNIIYFDEDKTEVNIGPNTVPGSFVFTNNLWFNESSNRWRPNLPVVDSQQIIADPLFINATNEDFHIEKMSPCIGNGKYLGSPITDFSGEPFLQPPSIGAYEGGDATTSTPSDHNAISFSISPNPTSDILTIHNVPSNHQVMLVDLNGRILFSQKEIDEETLLNLLPFPKGSYYVVVEDKEGRIIWTEMVCRN